MREINGCWGRIIIVRDDWTSFLPLSYYNPRMNLELEQNDVLFKVLQTPCLQELKHFLNFGTRFSGLETFKQIKY